MELFREASTFGSDLTVFDVPLEINLGVRVRSSKLDVVQLFSCLLCCYSTQALEWMRRECVLRSCECAAEDRLLGLFE